MAAVFVFIQQGCSACHAYMPRFERVARRWRRERADAWWHFPVGVYDLARGGHPEAFAHKLGIRATPTTVVLDQHGRLHYHVGDLPDDQIRRVLESATR